MNSLLKETSHAPDIYTAWISSMGADTSFVYDGMSELRDVTMAEHFDAEDVTSLKHFDHVHMCNSSSVGTVFTNYGDAVLWAMH